MNLYINGGAFHAYRTNANLLCFLPKTNYLCISKDIDIFTESTMWKQIIINQMMLKMILPTKNALFIYTKAQSTKQSHCAVSVLQIYKCHSVPISLLNSDGKIM